VVCRLKDPNLLLNLAPPVNSTNSTATILTTSTNNLAVPPVADTPTSHSSIGANSKKTQKTSSTNNANNKTSSSSSSSSSSASSSFDINRYRSLSEQIFKELVTFQDPTYNKSTTSSSTTSNITTKPPINSAANSTSTHSTRSSKSSTHRDLQTSPKSTHPISTNSNTPVRMQNPTSITQQAQQIESFDENLISIELKPHGNHKFAVSSPITTSTVSTGSSSSSSASPPPSSAHPTSHTVNTSNAGAIINSTINSNTYRSSSTSKQHEHVISNNGGHIQLRPNGPESQRRAISQHHQQQHRMHLPPANMNSVQYSIDSGYVPDSARRSTAKSAASSFYSDISIILYDSNVEQPPAGAAARVVQQAPNSDVVVVAVSQQQQQTQQQLQTPMNIDQFNNTYVPKHLLPISIGRHLPSSLSSCNATSGRAQSFNDFTGSILAAERMNYLNKQSHNAASYQQTGQSGAKRTASTSLAENNTHHATNTPTLYSNVIKRDRPSPPSPSIIISNSNMNASASIINASPEHTPARIAVKPRTNQQRSTSEHAAANAANNEANIDLTYEKVIDYQNTVIVRQPAVEKKSRATSIAIIEDSYEITRTDHINTTRTESILTTMSGGCSRTATTPPGQKSSTKKQTNEQLDSSLVLSSSSSSSHSSSSSTTESQANSGVMMGEAGSLTIETLARSPTTPMRHHRNARPSREDCEIPINIHLSSGKATEAAKTVPIQSYKQKVDLGTSQTITTATSGSSLSGSGMAPFSSKQQQLPNLSALGSIDIEIYESGSKKPSTISAKLKEQAVLNSMNAVASIKTAPFTGYTRNKKQKPYKIECTSFNNPSHDENIVYEEITKSSRLHSAFCSNSSIHYIDEDTCSMITSTMSPQAPTTLTDLKIDSTTSVSTGHVIYSQNVNDEVSVEVKKDAAASSAEEEEDASFTNVTSCNLVINEPDYTNSLSTASLLASSKSDPIEHIAASVEAPAVATSVESVPPAAPGVKSKKRKQRNTQMRRSMTTGNVTGGQENDTCMVSSSENVNTTTTSVKQARREDLASLSHKQSVNSSSQQRTSRRDRRQRHTVPIGTAISDNVAYQQHPKITFLHPPTQTKVSVNNNNNNNNNNNHNRLLILRLLRTMRLIWPISKR
jgi:hypothetical protein